MNRYEKHYSFVRGTLVLLTVLFLLFPAVPTAVFAAENNPANNTLSDFPAAGVDSDNMDINSGKIETLHGSGILNCNEGYITCSQGTVKENFGSIVYLEAGHVGTNYGNIQYIRNTGSLSVNDSEGTVMNNIGNKIDRNYGTIIENFGSVSENYQDVLNNHGTVNMRDGTITTNFSTGTVTFESKISGGETISPVGTIQNNEGRVLITDGTVKIENNTGNIEIKNALVTVNGNSGHISVGENGVLLCTENSSEGVITKTSASAKVDCADNRGTVDDTFVKKYKIVFIGDDGQALIIACDKEDKGTFYTKYGSTVIFSLPSGYACSSAFSLAAISPDTWGIQAYPEEEDTEFVVICHKCTSDKYMYDADNHWKICMECDRKILEDKHTVGEFKPDNNDTCIKDGTETYSCVLCGYSQSRIIKGSHFNSVNHKHIVIDPPVEPTETSAGLTEGSHCADCNAVLVAQQIIPSDYDSLLPQTGDHRGITLWIALLVISCGILTGIVVYDIQKKPDC